MSPTHDSLGNESTWTPDHLLAHAGWMQNLAAGLLSSQDRGRDLVQDAMVGAIERPPRHAGQVRGWLRKAIVHRARDVVRSESSRREREHLAARLGAAPSALELAARAELHRRLVEAVLRLDEPYRSTVLLRFYHGYEPRQIAAAAGVPAATVRTRIRRGLEQLRAALDAAYRGEARHWSAVALAGTASVATRSVGLSGLPAAVALACVLGLALAAAVISIRGPVGKQRPRSEGTDVPTAADLAQASPPGTVEPLKRGSEVPEARVPADIARPLAGPTAVREQHQARVPRPARATRLSGQVRDADTGVPLARVELRMGSRHFVVTDHAGHYEWERVAADTPVHLSIYHPDYAVGELRTLTLPFPSATRDIELDAGSPCTITCLDAFALEPVEGVVLEGVIGTELGRSDGGGAISFRVRRGQKFYLRLTHDDYARTTWFGTVKDASAFEHVILPMKRFARITGTARDRSGVALEGAYLIAYAPDEPRALSAASVGLPGPWAFPGDLQHEAPTSDPARVDASGSFSVPVVPSTHPFRVCVHRRTASRDRQALIVQSGVVVEAPETRTNLSLVVPDTGRLVGRVTAADAPVRGATVLVRHASEWSHSTRTDENGAYSVDLIPPGEVEVTLQEITGAARIDSRKVLIRSEETSRIDTAWTEDMAEVRGVATHWDGAPAVGEQVVVHRRVGAQSGGTFKGSTDSKGRFKVQVPVEGQHEVRVERYPVASTPVSVEPGGNPVEVVVPATGWIALRVEDATTGKPIESSAFRHHSASWSSDACPRPTLLSSRPVDPRNLDDGVESPAGVIYFEVAGKTPESRITLELHLADQGYAPVVLEDVPFASDRSAATAVPARLSRGVGITIKLEGEEPFTRERAEGVRLFFLKRGDLNAVGGPFPEGSPECNIQLEHVPMRLDRLTLLQNQADFGHDGAALFQGLAPGEYSLRAFPPSFQFEPEWIDVGVDGKTAVLTWSEP